MYDLINQIINHSWVSQGAGEQQYIYAIAGILICLLVVFFVDIFYRLFRAIFKKGDFYVWH